MVATQAEPLIELRGISKAFGSNVILDDVDLSIYRGEALVIIGPLVRGNPPSCELLRDYWQQMQGTFISMASSAGD